MRKYSLSILVILLLTILLSSTAYAESEQNNNVAAATTDSIEFVSFTADACDSVQYKVKVTVGSELAAKGYGIGIQYSTNEQFSRSGQNIFFGQDMDGSVTYTNTFDNETLSFSRISLGLVPGVHYYARPVVVIKGMGINASVTGATIEFTAPQDATPFTELNLDNVPTINMQGAPTDFMRARFTAPSDGLYVLDADGFDFMWALRENGAMISSTQSAQNSSLWMRVPVQMYQGETVYFVGAVRDNSGSQLGWATIKTAASVSASEDRIQSSDPFTDGMTNTSMSLDFYVDTTVETATNGYTVAVAFSQDLDFDVNTSRRSPAYELSHRPVSWTDYGDRTTATVKDFAPGTTIYYKAVLIKNGQIIAQEADYHTVSFDSSLNNFTALDMNSTENWNSNRERMFYFEAPSAGVYAIQVTGATSAMIRYDNATSMDRGAWQSSYLFGFHAAAGEKVFAYVENQNGNNCGITVFSGTAALPNVTMGAQVASTLPAWFEAPESGRYQFSQNIEGADLNWWDEYADTWQPSGSGFEMHMPKGQIVWLFTTVNGRSVSPDLTVEQMPSLKRVVFPADLTALDEEACAGNSMEEAVFVGNGLLSIGDRAFINCTELDTVVIPVENVEIGLDAFQNCRANLTIIAPGGGSVEEYAANHNIRFIPQP